MRWLKRHWCRIGLSLMALVVVLLHSLGVAPLGLLDRLDGIFYDARMRVTMPQTRDDRIVIVDIDEKSLAELGRWPWSRHKLAALTDALFEQQQIALLGFDVVFAEPDDSSGLKQLAQLAQQDLRDDANFIAQFARIKPLLDNDGAFARALQNRPVVLGYYFTSDRAGHASGVLPQPVMTAQAFEGRQVPFTDWNGYGANISILAQAAPLAGFFNSIIEPDGVVRALALVARYAGNYYESLPLAMFRRLAGLNTVGPGFAPEFFAGSGRPAIERLVVARGADIFSIPVDNRIALLLPFRGRGGVTGGSFLYVSAADVLTGRLPDGSLKGKIVLVGTTAPGAVDLRATPVDAVYPGIEVHANVLSSLLDRRFLIKPADALGYEVALLLLLGVSLAFGLPRLRAAAAMVASLAVAGTLLVLNGWLYLSHGIVLSLAPALFLTVLIFVVDMSYGYLATSRSRRQLIDLFGTYVPPEVVREMIKDPEHFSMKAKSEELTVMFCDIRGFTQMSEQMDPLALQQLLNHLFNELTRVIGTHSGTVDKYMGDCVMAFWGAPVETPAHAQLAVSAALQMAQLAGNISLGIGINTGRMYVGDMGSELRRSYTVIGDAVNLASRLEGLSKIYGVSVLVSESTRALASSFVWQELDRVRVKGKAQAITLYTPLAPVADLTPELSSELLLWENFLMQYRSQNWALCERHIAQLVERVPGKRLYQLYAQRVAGLRAQAVSPDWDGITNFENK